MQTNYSLKSYNSFHFNVSSRNFIEINDFKQFQNDIRQGKYQNEKIQILGGGNNVLFTDDFSGTVFHPVNESIEILEKNKDEVLLKVAAGKDWDNFVEYTVGQGFYGLENLSLIPGQVGASPIQNIGAYGVEVKDCIDKVEGFFLDTGETFAFENETCQFAYRNSVFKSKFRDKVFITYVYFRLSFKEKYHLTYGNLKDSVENFGEINLHNVRKAVIDIRNKKLPNPDEIGNAGSFFKNPVVNASELERIKQSYPDVPYFEQEDGSKISAAWLIDTAGWKAYRKGDAGVHKNHALVLVNYGSAKPQEIVSLSERIINDVREKFGVSLEPEVRFV